MALSWFSHGQAFSYTLSFLPLARNLCSCKTQIALTTRSPASRRAHNVKAIAFQHNERLCKFTVLHSCLIGVGLISGLTSAAHQRSRPGGETRPSFEVEDVTHNNNHFFVSPCHYSLFFWSNLLQAHGGVHARLSWTVCATLQGSSRLETSIWNIQEKNWMFSPSNGETDVTVVLVHLVSGEWEHAEQKHHLLA